MEEESITTLNSLSKEIKGLSTTVETLAIMVAHGFESVGKDIQDIKSEMTSMKSDISQIKTELHDFKLETRDRFDTLEEKLSQTNEDVSAVVTDYHPHIIALEEKVFGSSSLAEV